MRMILDKEMKHTDLMKGKVIIDKNVMYLLLLILVGILALLFVNMVEF